MKLLLSTALLALCMAIPAAAQRDIIETVVVRSDNPNDIFRGLDFGYGPNFTDGMDCFTQNECEVPAVPPSFWVMFIDQKENFGLNKDIRGVPDSVASGAATKFTLVYELEISRDQSPTVIIAFPDALTPGIDSIVVVDKITRGSAFRHVFKSGNSQVTIPFGDAIRAVMMTVYYDRRAAAVRGPILADGASRPLLYPNPVRTGGTLALRTPVTSQNRYEIVDMLGRQVGTSLEAPAVPGFYIARIFDRAGEMVAAERLLVVP